MYPADRQKMRPVGLRPSLKNVPRREDRNRLFLSYEGLCTKSCASLSNIHLLFPQAYRKNVLFASYDNRVYRISKIHRGYDRKLVLSPLYCHNLPLTAVDEVCLRCWHV